MRRLVTKETRETKRVTTPPKVTTFGSQTSPIYYDAFRRKFTPTDSILVREYKRTVFACANINASGVVNTPLRLFLKTENNSQKSVLRKGVELASSPVSKTKIEYLQKLPYLQKTLRSFINIEEVIRHPILDILEKANESRHLNGQLLKEFTQLYQEITGKSYWLVETDPIFNLPKNLWILPSQYVDPVKEDNNSRRIVDFYEYWPPGRTEAIKYLPEDIIEFKMPSLANPYADGLSPLEASFEANAVNNKLLTHEDALLENEGRPELIVAPKDSEQVFGKDEAERFEKEFRMKFGRGRSGGVWVPEEPITLIPVQLPPRDLARLEINKWSKNDIANAFEIPFALIADASHNRQQLEAAEIQHAKYGIRKRLNRNAAVLNDLFVPVYDQSGRLFLAYDDPVPEDEEKKTAKLVNFVMNGIWTPNEARNIDGTYGASDAEGADDLRAINVSPEIARQNKREADGDTDNENE